MCEKIYFLRLHQRLLPIIHHLKYTNLNTTYDKYTIIRKAGKKFGLLRQRKKFGRSFCRPRQTPLIAREPAKSGSARLTSADNNRLIINYADKICAFF